MAIIVDKEKKRSDIACSCMNILLQYGIGNITISQIAKTAGVGKGTIYEYFENKKDIVFEIITMFIRQQYQRLVKKGKNKMFAIVAAANKLLRQVFGVLKSGKPFNENYVRIYNI